MGKTIEDNQNSDSLEKVKKLNNFKKEKFVVKCKQKMMYSYKCAIMSEGLKGCKLKFAWMCHGLLIAGSGPAKSPAYMYVYM